MSIFENGPNSSKFKNDELYERNAYVLCSCSAVLKSTIPLSFYRFFIKNSVVSVISTQLYVLIR